MNQFGLFQDFNPPTLRPLRPRQAAAIEAIRDAVKEGHKRIVLQAPCGFGKTLTAAHLVSSSLAKGKRPLFTCPAITLVNQTLQSFEREGIEDIGVIQADHERTNYSCQMQIASVQTLIRRALPEVDFILIDECHMAWDKLYERLDSPEWKDKIAIGLSATPWTKGMGLHWTKLVIAATIVDLIGEGFLSPFVVYAPVNEFEPDLSGVKVTKGEFEEAGVANAVDKDAIVADVVKTWLEKGQNRPTFLFAVNRAHAQHLQNEFRKAGVNCGYIDAFSGDGERDITFRRFRSGEDRVIASVGCLTTGVDEDVRCIIDAGPTRSEIKHVQKIGRGLRLAPNKDYLLILDHAGNTIRLGMVTDILHETLDARKPAEKGEAYQGDKKPSKPRKCPQCNMIVPHGRRSCPNCGQAMLKNEVMHVDGELALYESDGPIKKRAERSDEQAFYSGLLDFSRRRGFKDGWAANKYRERFGAWPDRLEKTPMTPRKIVREFIAESARKWRAEQKGKKRDATALHQTDSRSADILSQVHEGN